MSPDVAGSILCSHSIVLPHFSSDVYVCTRRWQMWTVITSHGLMRGYRLSFYKEELAHETNNYIQIRAASERTSGIAILRKLAHEVLDTLHRIEQLMADDAELSALWAGYVQVREPLAALDIRSDGLGNGAGI